MRAKSLIDVHYPFWTETGGRDTDGFSRTLAEYHRLLWSKPLPDGTPFRLIVSQAPPYRLRHESGRGTFVLSSDYFVNGPWKLPNGDAGRASIYVDRRVLSSLGAFLVFPANRIDRKMTINGARGTHPAIRDRADLTLECIRRHYEGTPSPLSAVLERYRDFFALFESFASYAEFFLLQDLVRPNGREVDFHHPFTDFGDRANSPRTTAELREYLERLTSFTKARSLRMGAVARTLPIRANHLGDHSSEFL